MDHHEGNEQFANWTSPSSSLVNQLFLWAIFNRFLKLPEGNHCWRGSMNIFTSLYLPSGNFTCFVIAKTARLWLMTPNLKMVIFCSCCWFTRAYSVSPSTSYQECWEPDNRDVKSNDSFHTWWFIPRIVSGLVHPSFLSGRLAPTKIPFITRVVSPTYDQWDEPPSSISVLSLNPVWADAIPRLGRRSPAIWLRADGSTATGSRIRKTWWGSPGMTTRV